MSAGSSRDPRYDVVLRETYLSDPAEGYQVDLAAGDLPLMLTEQGTLGYTVGLTSPYGGRLSQGDLQDADLSQYTSRTQRDWSGGRGIPDSFASTDAYLDGNCNCLIPNRLLPAMGTWRSSALGTPVALTSTTADVVTVPVKRWEWGFAGTVGFYTRGRDFISASAGTHNCRATLTAAVTDIEPFEANLYCAQGDSADMEYVAPTTLAITALASRRFTYLLTYAGYLYGLQQGGAMNYFNGTSWLASNIQIGRPGYQTFTGMAGFRNEVIFAATTGLWSISADIPYQVYSFDELSSENAGSNLRTWVADGLLYVPVGEKLLAYDGTSMAAVWPIPTDDIERQYRGSITALATTQRLLFIAVNAGANGGYSRIYCKAAGGNWHLVYQSANASEQIKSLNALQVGSDARLVKLLFFEDGYFRWLNVWDEFSDLRLDNYPPTADTGTLTSSWTGTELRRIDKELAAIIVTAESIQTLAGTASTAATIAVEAECDRTGIWVTAGTITLSGVQPVRQYEFEFSAPNYTSTVSSYTAATRALVVASASGISAGQFIRIGREVRQVTNVAGTTLTLHRELDSAPAASDPVYGSVPVAREFRYRLSLDPGGSSQDLAPVVHAVTWKYQDQLVDRYRFTLQIRVEDGMKDNADGAYPLTAAQLRTRLYSQFRRGTPMRMISPTGDLFTVKVANVNEAMFSEQKDGAVTQTKKSMMIASLIEV